MGIEATKAVGNTWARLVAQDLQRRGIDAVGGLRKAGLNAVALADEESWSPFAKRDVPALCCRPERR
jgi:hypothetical protein